MTNKTPSSHVARQDLLQALHRPVLSKESHKKLLRHCSHGAETKKSGGSIMKIIKYGFKQLGLAVAGISLGVVILVIYGFCGGR